MHAEVAEIVDELGTAALPAGPRRGRADPGPADSGWPTTTSRSSATASTASSGTTTTSTSAASPAPGSASCAPTRTCPRRRAGCLALAGAKAREKTLLVLTKANSRSTVHRPAYLDYVGVKKFENGEVVGERRFLGLYSSAAYTESLTRIPLLRERAAAVLKRIGFTLQSHDGKALMDTLETYPRDELFHTSVDELAPMAEAGDARPRAPAAAALHPPRHLRPLRLGARLPAARPLQHRSPRAVLADPQGPAGRRLGRVHGPADRVDDGAGALRRAPAARARPSPRSTPPTSSAGSPRRPARGATTSRPPSSAEYGEEAGARLARRYLDSFPEAYKEDFSPRVGASDLGRFEAIELDDDGTGIDLSLYEDLDAGRGEARLKVYRVGRAALALADPADALLDGGRGRRRASLRARRPGASDVHLRVRPALRRGRCPTTPASSSRTRSARSGTATTRSTASTRWCCPPD